MSSHLWSISYTYSNRYYNAFKSFFSDNGEESVTVTGKQSRANSPVPGPYHVLSQPEQINQGRYIKFFSCPWNSCQSTIVIVNHNDSDSDLLVPS